MGSLIILLAIAISILALDNSVRKEKSIVSQVNEIYQNKKQNFQEFRSRRTQ